MRKTAFLVLLVAAGGGILCAQTAAPTSVIQGTLGLRKGNIAVTSGNIAYYVKGLERYIGFIDGLKDGAQVAIEGYASAPLIEGQTERLFYPVKLTLNGKVYEVGSPEHPVAPGRKAEGVPRRPPDAGGRHRPGR
jgi:hypothetical protein